MIAVPSDGVTGGLACAFGTVMEPLKVLSAVLTTGATSIEAGKGLVVDPKLLVCGLVGPVAKAEGGQGLWQGIIS